MSLYYYSNDDIIDITTILFVFFVCRSYYNTLVSSVIINTGLLLVEVFVVVVVCVCQLMLSFVIVEYPLELII